MLTARFVRKEFVAPDEENKSVATNFTTAQQVVFTTFVISGIIGIRLGGFPFVMEALPS